MLGTNGGAAPLTAREARTVGRYLGLIRQHVPAELVQALLFGSRARGTARPDSDVDVLLIWRELPPDREPQATIAEEIAERVAEREGVPVEPWSVSLIDLCCGERTPMLVDALHDGIGLWPAGTSVPRLPFTPADAVRCTGALLQRVAEGSAAVVDVLRRGDRVAATRQARDDIVRMCTAALLLEGETRPRRADAVACFARLDGPCGPVRSRFEPQLRWAADSFGPAGRDESLPLTPPPSGLDAALDLVDALRGCVVAERDRLAARLGGRNPRASAAYDLEAAAV